MEFPWGRVRRLARTPSLRRLTRSVRVSGDELVPSLRVPVEGSAEAAQRFAGDADDAGFSGLYLAPTARRRDADGSEVGRADAPLAEALAAARRAAPALTLFAELDLSVFQRSGRPAAVVEGLVDLEAAFEALGKAAVTLAEAGADVLALRGLVDGGVGALREALDEAGLDRVAILAFSGDLWSPFAELRPRTADKAADLLDPHDPGAILRQAEADVGEGADLIGVQPCALALDLLRELAEEHHLPVVARITDLEAKVFEGAARSSVASLDEIVEAVHGSLLRAGARLVVTPWALAEADEEA